MTAQRPPRMSRLKRELARVMGRQRGEVRALQDMTALHGVIRFTALYGVTVLVPALVLSLFALSSIRAEELYVDADIRRRAETVSEQVHHELEGVFVRFEQSTRERLGEDQSALAALADLSPYLRAAFLFDANGNLVAPFALPEPVQSGVPSSFYEDTLREARRLEHEQRWREAADVYQVAARAARDPSLAGEAAFGRARSLRKAGEVAVATRAFEDIFADYGNLRDRQGFQLGDLAILERAEIALERDPDVGAQFLLDLVERLLSGTQRWTIGRPGEAAVARRALALLDRHGEDEFVARSRTRLNERVAQLYWAERLSGELELLVDARTAGERPPPAEFQYIERPDSGTLWATVWWEEQLYAFAFDYDQLVQILADTTNHAETLDADIRATLLGPNLTSVDPSLADRSLAPWLPSLTVAVSAADPDLLLQRKARKRAIRIVIILIAVGMSVVGVLLAARLLNREVEAARMKADFAANVSHELRSPITQIRLKGESLQLGLAYDEEDRAKHYDAIVHEAERLSRLVDNVLDFSSIERGAKRYTFRAEDLGEIVRNTVEAARETLESRGLQVEVDVPDDLPVVWVDREAIAQVVTNLLSNAAKYGADGGWVGVRARVGAHGVTLAISDRGVGIRKEDQAKIFDRFYRSADPNVRRYRGTGIGLTIVRYIVDEHGGDIRVDSVPGAGTTFTITFPLEPRDSGA